MDRRMRRPTGDRSGQNGRAGRPAGPAGARAAMAAMRRPFAGSIGAGGPQLGGPGPLPGDRAAETGADEDAFPSLRKVPAVERADEIVAELKEAILNPGRLDGGTGMAYSDWSKIARKKITKAIRDAEMAAAMRELMSANRIGGLCLRIGFLLLAAVAAFAAFWWGATLVWDSHGPAYGLAAIISALALCIAFVVAGLMMSGEDVEEFRRDVKRKFGRD